MLDEWEAPSGGVALEQELKTLALSPRLHVTRSLRRRLSAHVYSAAAFSRVRVLTSPFARFYSILK